MRVASDRSQVFMVKGGMFVLVIVCLPQSREIHQKLFRIPIARREASPDSSRKSRHAGTQGASGRRASMRKKYFACGLASVSVTVVLVGNPVNHPDVEGVHDVKSDVLITRYWRVSLLVNVSDFNVRVGSMLCAVIRRWLAGSSGFVSGVSPRSVTFFN
jgi:hypothetical protein